MEQFLDTLLVVLGGCPVTFHYSSPVSEISWGSGLIWAYNMTWGDLDTAHETFWEKKMYYAQIKPLPKDISETGLE